MSFRQLCSIESAAFNNPNSNVYLYSLNTFYKNKLFDAYKNIKNVQLVPETLIKDTVLEEFWKNKRDRLLNSPYSVQHLSDLLRVVILWKYGGIILIDIQVNLMISDIS